MLLPDTTFYMRERDDTITGPNPFKWVINKTSDLFANKKVVIFGLPGAFTPTCSNDQLPTYEMLYHDFVAKGVDEVWCTSVNDAFVMYQWGQSQNLKNVKLLPDGNGDFARGLGVLVDKSNLGFGLRSWRYAMLVDNLVIEEFWAEENQMDNCPTDPYDMSNAYEVLSKV